MLNLKQLKKLGAGLCLIFLPLLAYAEKPNSIFLVASEKVQDPIFRHTVILVTQHRNSGPVGVIINRPELADKSGGDDKGLAKGRVFFGGPVAQEAHTFMFRKGEITREALQVLPNVQMSNNPALLKKLTSQSYLEQDIRIYRGFAAWATKQLEHEIARGDWLITEADEKSIFDKDPAVLWDELYKSLASRQFL